MPDAQRVDVELTLTQDRYRLREMRFSIDRLTDVDGDGELIIEAEELRWLPPRDGGQLRWRTQVPRPRNGDGYDAWLDSDWGLFRAEDIIPRAATRTLRGSRSETTLLFRSPPGWSVVTEYFGNDGRFRVRAPNRRFVQPSGWIVMGDLGIRRDRIAGIRVAVAAPEAQNARRIDMLALLNWTLPELVRLVPDPPSRLTIVIAGEPMWRGGLSGPRSIYLHADRPLISENGTSTLLHEVAHVLFSIRAEPGYDWIVEGLAEYYSLEALRRSGTLTPERHSAALASQRKWAEDADSLCAPSSSGARTALAVTVLYVLDAEISRATHGERNLDDAVHTLLALPSRVGLDSLRRAAGDLIGENPDALHIDKLPGCRTMTTDSETSQ